MSAFTSHSHNTLGAHPDTVGDEAFWKLAKAHPSFWEDMPLMDGALDFWIAIKHLSPTVLTGAPRSDFDRAAKAKKEWWKNHFDHDDVIVCLSKHKQNYCKNSDDVLIDDRGYIVKRWIAAGGTGILFRNYEQALADLKALGIL